MQDPSELERDRRVGYAVLMAVYAAVLLVLVRIDFISGPLAILLFLLPLDGGRLWIQAVAGALILAAMALSGLISWQLAAAAYALLLLHRWVGRQLPAWMERRRSRGTGEGRG